MQNLPKNKANTLEVVLFNILRPNFHKISQKRGKYLSNSHIYMGLQADPQAKIGPFFLQKE